MYIFVAQGQGAVKLQGIKCEGPKRVAAKIENAMINAETFFLLNVTLY